MHSVTAIPHDVDEPTVQVHATEVNRSADRIGTVTIQVAGGVGGLGEIWESRTRSNAHEHGRSVPNPLAANPLKHREYAVAGLLPRSDRRPWHGRGRASSPRAQERAATPSTMPSRDGEDRQKCNGQESRERQTSLMTKSEPKADLLLYLQSARDALLWKLDGLSEYDIRRPLTPTGTNLLGLVKHVTGVELGYLGATFERSSGEPMPWLDDDAEPNSDYWATADESREQIIERYRRAWTHSNATIDAVPLNATGKVPWWPSDGNEVTLHHAVVRVIADTQRHAGHADILRELIDGAVGMSKGNESMTPGDSAWWENYRSRLEHVARKASHMA